MMSQNTIKTHLLPAQPKASVLGVGSELTSGQIVNKNGSWISNKLKSFGLKTSSHLVVPDERPLILKALDFCASESDIIFITGGLGPTSDDFTRDLVQQWTGLEMEFDEESWKKVIERLTSRGYAVQDFQKQQCYFPKTSWILNNQQGTANAFYVYAKSKHFFVLPGPPREIESVWNDHINQWLTKNTAHIDPLLVKSWDTLGVGESEIARRVEEIVQGTNFEIGYRVHLPYVETKITYFKSQSEQVENFIQKITAALADITKLQDGQDAADLFGKKLLQFQKIFIFDDFTKGYLHSRLQNQWKNLLSQSQIQFSNSLNGLKNIKMTDLENSALVLQISRVSDHEAEVSLITSLKDFSQNAGFKKRLTTPYKTDNMKERSQQIMAEMALLEWLELI